MGGWGLLYSSAEETADVATPIAFLCTRQTYVPFTAYTLVKH